jgi:hypothetical protein
MVFGSLFFLKYTFLLMFVEAFGTIAFIQALVQLFRKRDELYNIMIVCTRTVQRLPSQLSNVADRLGRAGASAMSSNSSYHLRRGNHGDDGDSNGDEEEGMRETDRLTGGDVSPTVAAGAAGAEDEQAPAPATEEWDAEYDGDTRSQFATLLGHPLTTEPVTGMSSVILSWLAFITMQWFWRHHSVSEHDSTTNWMHNGAATADIDADISVGDGTAAQTNNSTDTASLATPPYYRFSRGSMAEESYTALGVMPVLVGLAPVFFMILARVTQQGQTGSSLSSHLRFTIGQTIMYAVGLLLAAEFLTFLNTWYWLFCFSFSGSLLVLASVVANRRCLLQAGQYGGGGAVVRTFLSFLHACNQFELGRRRRRGSGGDYAALDDNDSGNDNVDDDGDSDGDDDLRTGRGMAYFLLDLNVFDADHGGRVHVVYTTVHMQFDTDNHRDDDDGGGGEYTIPGGDDDGDGDGDGSDSGDGGDGDNAGAGAGDKVRAIDGDVEMGTVSRRRSN